MEQRTSELGDFYAFSVALTGFSLFELRALGTGEDYFRTAFHEAPRLLPELLSRYRDVERRCDGSEEAVERAVRAEIMNRHDLASLTRKIIRLWYLGHWDGGSAPPPAPGPDDVAGAPRSRPLWELRAEDLGLRAPDSCPAVLTDHRRAAGCAGALEELLRRVAV